MRKKEIEYDSVTGEILIERDYSISSHLILKSKKKLFRKKMYNQTPNYTSRVYLGNWLILMDYLEKNTNRLVDRKIDDSNGTVKLMHVPIDLEQMIKILDLGRSSVCRFLKESKEQGHIRKSNISGEMSYYMNPVYALNGEGFDVRLYPIFEGVKSFHKMLNQLDKDKVSVYLGRLMIDEELLGVSAIS